ncbi:sensor histidine kinase [Amycolatopsis sp. NPDC059021]|uniref:sensor histidine kinase n=1 Tax=Amycolatopsis sp. NPDC059021 TaxID=3346704 RepID=UPI0036721F25
MSESATSRARLRDLLPTTLGLAIGAVTAWAELVYVVLGGIALALPAARKPVFGGARRLSEMERRRIERFFRGEHATGYSGPRALNYLAVRCVLGMLSAGIILLILYGAVSGVVVLVKYGQGKSPLGEGPAHWYDLLPVGALGILLLFVALQGLAGTVSLDRKLARRFLGPSQQELLRRRVSELSTSRAEVVEAVNGERRRIERDLHDGVQQRLVALGMLLGRARRAEGERAAELLRQAHEESQEALRDLREVTWRVYPIALDEGGLHTALEALAERSAVPVRLRYDLSRRPPAALETVAYFVASEAVTNTIKHAAATRIDIDVRREGESVLIEIADDGAGGARPGGGLSGLARRVAAADGEFTVDSPVGGPTVVRAVLPCG